MSSTLPSDLAHISYSSTSNEDLWSSLLPIVLPSSDPSARFQNWAKTFECLPGLVFRPTSIPQLIQIVTLAHRLRKQVRAAGAGHSPSDLACVESRDVGESSAGGQGQGKGDEENSLSRAEESGGWMIRMDGIDRVYKIDSKSNTIHLQSGTCLLDIHRLLGAHSPPMAMSNLGSISEQTIGGLISTASHGSGWDFPVMSRGILEMGVVMLPKRGAGGEGEVRVVRCSREENKELFLASLCGLGMTGLITDLVLSIEPAFRLRESKESMPFLSLLSPSSSYQDDPEDKATDPDHTGGMIDEIARSAEHVRMWWYPQVDGLIVARANRTSDAPQPPPTKIQAHWAHFLNHHMTQFLLFISIWWPYFTHFVGKWVWYLSKGRSVNVDDSWKVFTFDCLFPQHTTEWAIPYHLTRPCLQAMHDWLAEEAANPNGNRIHFPIEIRFVQEDDIWLSPAEGRRTCYIGIVQFKPYGFKVPYESLFSRFSAIMTSFEGRPHWAKQHEFGPADIKERWSHYDDFMRVVEEVDEEGMWGSEYTRRHLGR